MKDRLDRLADPLAQALVVLTLLAIPAWVLGLGFRSDAVCQGQAALIPGGPDPEAWQGFLRAAHRVAGGGPWALVALSTAGLFCLVMLAPLPWLKAPEAWLASWILLWAAGGPQGRLLMGRPFLVPVATLLVVCCLGVRGRFRPVLAGAAFALAALVQGGPPLALVPLAFLVAGRKREAGILALAWAVGTLAAVAVTGHLGPAAPVAAGMTGEHFAYSAVGPVALCLLWAVALRQGGGLDPLLVLWGGCWLIGLAAPRFWLDLGYPCAALWLAFQLEAPLVRLGTRSPGTRLALAAFLCVAAALFFTADSHARWTGSPAIATPRT